MLKKKSNLLAKSEGLWLCCAGYFAAIVWAHVPFAGRSVKINTKEL